MQENKRRSGPSLVWPVFLIGVGIIFLLNNLGILDWDVWYMLGRLWPLLLVAIGLDVIFGRRKGIWPAIGLVLIIAVFASGGWLVRTTTGFVSGELHTETISQPLEDAEQANIDINFGVGSLRIDALSGSDALAEGTLDLAGDEYLVQSFQIVGETAHYSLDSEGQQYYPNWFFDEDSHAPRTWDIAINPNVPLQLEINTGVGQSIIDLGELQITGLDINTGVGEVVVTLPATGQFDASVSGGVGELTIRIPSGMEVRLVVSTGLGNTNLVGDFHQTNGGAYTTPGYDGAENSVDLYVSGGVGQVRIVQFDE